MNRIVLAIAILWSISSADAHKVTVDFGHQAKFANYRTYCWVGPPEVESMSQLLADRVTGFVEEALASRHLKRVPAGCDLLIRFRMTVQEQEQYITYTSGFGGYWDWGTSVSTTVSDPILTSTLTVDMVDGRTDRLVFQGVSTQSLSSKPEGNTKKLAKAVNSIFAKYPPQ
jgi:hypothetical protein